MKTKVRSKLKTENRDDGCVDDQPNQSESHAGVLKPIEHHAGEFFEFGGQRLFLKGTSGPPKERSRIAEGQPIRHDVSIAGRTIPSGAMLDASQLESPIAAGRLVQHRSGRQDAASGLMGTGQVTGGPIRRA
jgi:hypothetical protein